MEKNKTLEQEILEEFDEKFADSFDLGMPNESQIEAGSEILFYNAIKTFLSTALTRVRESEREGIASDLKRQFGSLHHQVCNRGLTIDDILQTLKENNN